MTVPNRQIGWGTQENLLYEIAKQLEKLQCLLCGAVIPGPPGPPGPVGFGNYGAFYDTTTQSPGANVVTPMRCNHVAFASGITMSDDGVGNSIIGSTVDGMYNLQFSAQLKRTSGGNSKRVIIWLNENGSIVPNTATYVTMQANADYLVAAWNFIVPLSPTNTIQFMWMQDDFIEIASEPALEGVYPAVPGLIITVNQVA